MIQEIATYIVIASASLYTIYSFIRMVLPSKKHNHKSMCNSSCSGCSLRKELKIKPNINSIDLN